MKKMLAGLLVVLTLVCAMPIGAFAAEPEDEGVRPHFSAACPNCSTEKDPVPMDIKDTWVEYTYYYTIIWVNVNCGKCGYNTNEVLAQIPNQTTRKKNDNKGENATQVD